MNDNPNPFALIVEDDPDAAAIFAEALKASAPFQVEIVGAGDKALDWLAKHEPDMVVLDMHLPKVAGPEILQYIRSQDRLATSKVIIVTADANRADVDDHDGADYAFLKPVSFKVLRDLANHIIRKGGQS